jgi:hypothetical protein
VHPQTTPRDSRVHIFRRTPPPRQTDVHSLANQTFIASGSNENANGLLRQYFPKGTDLNIYTAEHLAAVEDEINNRPRLVLGDKTPAQLFSALLIASPDQPVLRR